MLADKEATRQEIETACATCHRELDSVTADSCSFCRLAEMRSLGLILSLGPARPGQVMKPNLKVRGIKTTLPRTDVRSATPVIVGVTPRRPASRARRIAVLTAALIGISITACAAVSVWVSLDQVQKGIR